MTTIVLTTTRTTAPIFPMLLAQIRAEFLSRWRIPAFTISSVAFPSLFYIFFGTLDSGGRVGSASAATYLLASFGAYGAISVALFLFGIGIANERGQRMHVLIRATPLRPWVFLAARTVIALGFVMLVLIPLYVLAVVFGGVRLDPTAWTALTLSLTLGSIPFAVLGFAVGYLTGPNTAPAVVNLLFLPLSFASGLFVPLAGLPEIVQKIAPYLPTYYLGQLAWNAVGSATESVATSILWLVGYTIIFSLIAARAYWREDSRLFS